MGSSVNELTLRWNDFESHIKIGFAELRQNKELFDVSLAVESNVLQAHKVLLSASSSFFKALLNQIPHSHPLIYLRGIRYSVLESLLHFMYYGEVNVRQEDLTEFLSVAEELQVKGLSHNESTINSETIREVVSQREKKAINETSTPTSDRKTVNSETLTSNVVQHWVVKDEENEIQDISLIKCESSSLGRKKRKRTCNSKRKLKSNLNNNNIEDEKEDENENESENERKRKEFLFSKNECSEERVNESEKNRKGNGSKNKYDCSICGKKYKIYQSLQIHKFKFHSLNMSTNSS